MSLVVRCMTPRKRVIAFKYWSTCTHTLHAWMLMMFVIVINTIDDLDEHHQHPGAVCAYMSTSLQHAYLFL